MTVESAIVKTFKQNRATGHLCFMIPLKDVLPAKANNVLYVFYDFETKQNRTYSDTAKEHCLTSSACNSFVRDVRKSKTVVSNVDNAAGECTHFGMIL